MNETESTSLPTEGQPSTSAASVARWRAEVEMFADHVNAELRELMSEAGQDPAGTRPTLNSTSEVTARTGAASVSIAGSVGPTADRDSETRLRSLREQFAAKLRRFEGEDAVPGGVVGVSPVEKGNDEHE